MIPADHPELAGRREFSSHRELAGRPELAGLLASIEAGTITGIATDNRAVQPGDLFAALPGAYHHGARFACAAMDAGARAIITDDAGAALITAARNENQSAPIYITEHPGQLVARLARLIYGNPSDQLTCYALTGTNGKTTAAFILDHLLTQLGRTTGLIGTVVTRIAGVDTPARLTTPQPADLQRLCRDLVNAGGTDLVMEASSHAIEQGRIEGITYAVSGFLNLTQDHLDYHGTLENYFATKARLFEPEVTRAAVICVDDEWGRRLYTRLAHAFERGERPTRPLALARTSTLEPHDVGWQIGYTPASGQLTFTPRNLAASSFALDLALPGDFNATNAALAVVMLLAAGWSSEAIVTATGGTVSATVPGRMELISTHPRVIVDFAHNPEALRAAASALRSTTAGRLIALTGSAGERDVDKRPQMGAILAELCDVVIITDDDPHHEDPSAIRADVLAGLQGSTTPWYEIADRSEAIHAAIAMADDDDTVLLAGRGHETVQDWGDTVVELDDRTVAREALAERHRQ